MIRAAPTMLQRVLLSMLPALVIMAVAVSAVWGDNGLLARLGLQVELGTANSELAAMGRHNERLLRELHSMELDPVVRERMVAEELGWGREDARIYRFDDRVRSR